MVHDAALKFETAPLACRPIPAYAGTKGRGLTSDGYPPKASSADVRTPKFLDTKTGNGARGSPRARLTQNGNDRIAVVC
jgi:hypothetical protein